MSTRKQNSLSRRTFIKTTAAAAVGVSIVPAFTRCSSKPKLLTRGFGRLNHEVTTFGLGGQASIQWTPDDVDPVAIILKAFAKGVNYFDTSNLYGPSQINYGKAFRSLDLIPGVGGYNESLRRSIFLTTKSHLRFAKGGWQAEGLGNWTNGAEGSHTIDDVKRTLSQVFGDGLGGYPKGAYVDMVLVHSLNNFPEVDALYEGLYDTDPKAENIGALAALRDYRDGTNLTGLNPDEEVLIKHIGFSGHYNTAVMMDMIQRDKDNLLDGLLVAINSNDKLNFNMQNNVIPVAKASNMGLIGMKVFADGAMYSKPATWTGQPGDVVREVGSKELPFKPLIQYTLTTPGISTAIIGIGEISDDEQRCQLTQNIAASQIGERGLSAADREEVEKMTMKVKDGKTNYFQHDKQGLSGPRDLTADRTDEGKLSLNWQTAYAGDAPIDRYEVWRNDELLGEVKHTPQTDQLGFRYNTSVINDSRNYFRVVAIDAMGEGVAGEEVRV